MSNGAAWNCPKSPAPGRRIPDPPCVTAPLQRLDLGAEGISAVIWATGYGVDFGWIDIPVTDAKGEAVHRNGITDVPGLYFLGLQWLSKMNSSFLSGVGDDAAVLADHIPPAADSARRRACRLPEKLRRHVNPFTSGMAAPWSSPGMGQSRETRHDLRRL